MKRINPEKWYNLLEALECTTLKSRETLSKYINRYQAADWAMGKVRTEGDAAGKRYYILGTWLQEFNRRHREGRLKEHGLFTPDEVRFTLSDIVKYCKKNKIFTVMEFVEKIKNQPHDNANQA